MKKRAFLLCTAACLLAAMLFGCAQQSEPTITTLSPTVTDPTEESVPPAEEPKTVTLHLITERVTGNTDGTLSRRTRATYDERGLTTSVLHEDFAIPNQSYHYVYHYNEHGHLLYQTNIENGKETNQTAPYSYNYNPDGTIASIGGYFEGNGSLEFEYDAQGQLLKATTTYYNGTPWPFATCKYNEAGLLSQLTISYMDKSVGASYGYKNEFYYDEQGRLIRLDSPSPYIGEYDQYGNLIQENDCYYSYSSPDGVIITAQNTREPEKRYIFDELGRLVRVEYDGRYIEWTFQTIEVPVENLNMSIPSYNRINKWVGIAGFYDNIAKYLLPTPNILSH